MQKILCQNLSTKEFTVCHHRATTCTLVTSIELIEVHWEQEDPCGTNFRIITGVDGNNILQKGQVVNVKNAYA